MAATGAAFSQDERQRLWDSYEGESGLNGGQEFLRSVDRRIAGLEEERAQLGCSSTPYESPRLRPSLGRHRDSQGDRPGPEF
jgi:hypothetical protein